MSSRQEYTEIKGLIQAIEDRAKKLIPQELLANYMYYRFVRAARVVPCYDVVELPLMPAIAALGQWVSRGSTLPETSTDSLALSSYNNRYLAVPTTLNLIDLWENENNPKAIFKESEYQAMKAAWGARRMLSNAVLNGTGGLQPDGIVGRILEKLAPAAQVQVVGTVDKATEPWFRNQFVQLTQNFGTIAAGTTIPAGFISAIGLLDACTIGQSFPTDFITTQTCFQMFRRGMMETSTAHHIATTDEDRTFGFRTMIFDGAKLGWDPQMLADTVCALHIGKDKLDDRRMGENSAIMDGDYEDAMVDNLFDLDGALFMIQNPNVKMRTINPRSPYRELVQTSWMIHSFNVGVGRMSDQGIAGSDNGARWETW